jgi:hypothetical protein
MDFSITRTWASGILAFILLFMTGCTGPAKPATPLPSLTPTSTATLLPTHTPRPSETVTPAPRPTFTPTQSQTSTPVLNVTGYYHPKVCVDLTSFPDRTLLEGDYIRVCVDEVDLFPGGSMFLVLSWFAHLPGQYALFRAHLDQSHLYGWIPIDNTKENLYLTDDLGNRYDFIHGDIIRGDILYVEARAEDTLYSAWYAFPPVNPGAVWFTFHHVALFDFKMKFDANDPGYSIMPGG